MGEDFFNNIDAGISEFGDISDIIDAAANLPAVIDEEVLPVDAPSEDARRRDINFAIANLKNVTKITEQAVREVFILSKSSDSPRSWEVLATLLKTNIDASKSILDASVPDKGFSGANVNVNNDNSVTNNVVIQSSEDLLSFLGDNDDVVDAEVIDDE